MTLPRALVFGLAVAASSWLVLAFAAGNVGLQRAVSSGPWTLLTERPVAALLAVATALAIAFVARPLLRHAGIAAGVVGVVAWNVIAAVVLAPLAVGELEVAHAPIVFGATTVLGLQLVAAWLGARLRQDVGKSELARKPTVVTD
jgi:hypothetical protein